MRKSFASRAFGFLPLSLLLGSSCSLVYDLSPDQCGSNADCVGHFGEGFVCNSGICACGEGNEDVCGPGTGGTTGTGGDGTGGTGGDGATGGSSASGGDAGMSSGGKGGSSGTGGDNTGGTNGGNGGSNGGRGGSSGGTGGTTGDAGMAGMPDEPECEKNADCAELKSDSLTNPYACVKGKCQQLLSDDCPVILPFYDNNEWSLLLGSKAEQDPIILGGFAILTGGIVGIETNNYDLALMEMNQQTNGVFAGSGSRHPLMMVVCHSIHDLTKDLMVPAEHLINDLDVKGIVSSLESSDLQYVFENLGHEKNVFFMDPLQSDQQLIDLGDDGLLWHMLAGADALTLSMQPLIDLTQTHLKNLGSIAMTGEDTRVAMMTATDERFLADMGEYIKAHVTINGELAKNNTTAQFKSVAVSSDPMDDNTTQIDNVVAFLPHIIIGATTDDMLKRIIPDIESQWDTATSGQDRPFYLLSPYNYQRNISMPALINADTSMDDGKVPLYQRILGYAWPAAVDQTVYEDYQDRYYEQYQMAAPGNENFYDSAYYLLYAVAASVQPLTGKSIRDGMQRVIQGSLTTTVGPTDEMAPYVLSLSNSASFEFTLISAEGPPAWDSRGARNDAGSIWCINGLGIYAPDQLRYNDDTMGLDGTITATDNKCFDFPAP